MELEKKELEEATFKPNVNRPPSSRVKEYVLK
jgi:hypothetical protein